MQASKIYGEVHGASLEGALYVFCKHLSICDPALGPNFHKEI
jgi:hypothetical protein